MRVRIKRKTLSKITDSHKERNIYTHPFFLARDIFWQRLEYVFEYLVRNTQIQDKILDFGGGSGILCKSLSAFYKQVSIIDLDVDDAINIIKHYDLNNVKIINEDITTYKSKNKYSIIVATDVLEHFFDLQDPATFFSNFLRKNGILVVTLPTENKLYELGRLILNKTKPLDHYHSSKEVINFLEKRNFELIELKYVPRYLSVPIPLFEFAVFKFNGTQ